MNKQEIFDKVIQGLWNQQEYGYDPNKEICQYRTSNGKRCAVGMLISDENYSPEMEDRVAFRVFAEYPNCLGFPIIDEVTELVSDLQRTHDELAIDAITFDAVDFVAKFRVVAKMHKLSTELLDSFRTA